MATEGQTSGPSGAAYLRLILLAAPIGIPAALVAAVFLALVHWLEDWLWTRPASPAGELVASVVSGARSAGDRRRYRHRWPGGGCDRLRHLRRAGDLGGLHQTAMAVPGLPAYEGTDALDLLVGLGVGIAAALVIGLVRRAGAWVEGRRDGRGGLPVLLVAGALAVGLLALLADALGASSQDVLFSGQSSVPTLAAEQSVGIVAVLLVAKALAYAVSLGCGFRGGPVFPAVFLGIALASLAEIAFGISPTLAVALGTAAGMASTTRLLFAPLLFAVLLVGSNGLDAVPAAVLASAGAWVTTTMLEARPPRAAHLRA